jgi:hypothetical protein
MEEPKDINQMKENIPQGDPLKFGEYMEHPW